MLKNLRRKFIVIIMVLVGGVLLTVLGGSLVTAYKTQHDLTIEGLNRTLNGELHDMPRITMNPDMDGKPNDDKRFNMLILAVDLDADGIVLATNNAPVLIDTEALSGVIKTALSSESDFSWDEANHIAWKRLQRSSGAWRVAIADTSTVDLSLRSLAANDAIIFVVAMGALFVIALGLSTWVLKPVEAAWQQQRQFVSDASHELKTPLAVIIANTQILMTDDAIPQESRRWIESTSEESTHMKNLVEELLELARTDESSSGAQGIMQHKTVDFSSMVENASLEFDAVAFEHGTHIDDEIEPDISVTGDPEWLGRLCKILIENACKYSKGDAPVTVRLASERRKCVLEVNNYGNVIDPEDLPHVFDRFYRTDKARSRDANTGGFGLGLAIAKGVATSHGGDISVNSNAEEGTTFHVTLPLS